jgi:hypothetical protein
MTDCATYGSTVFTLIFSGSIIGDHIYSTISRPRLATKINERQNLWASSVVLDGRYPALVHDHQFVVYNEESYRLDYMRWFYNLASRIDGDPHSLTINLGNNVVVAFGDCYLLEPQQREPDSLLLQSAGLVEVAFLGTSIPSVI